MSKENLVKLLEAASADEALMQQLQSTSSYEEVKSLAREQSLDLGNLSEEDAGRVVRVVTGETSEELSDEELEMVAGGAGKGLPKKAGRGLEGWIIIES